MYATLKPSIVLLILSLSFGACAPKDPQHTTPKTSEEELKSIITAQVDSLYKLYEQFGYAWIEFYADEFTAIYPETPVSKKLKADLISEWDDIYKKYDVKLLDRGRPTIIPSEDMAISYNSFNEIFINKETSDTIKNVGTYIITWKRQADDSWKIVFETLQNI